MIWRPTTLNCRGLPLDLKQPVVMGIVNLAPDSFYSPSSVQLVDEILQKVNKMISEGASIIDIGPASSRPGALPLDSSEEIHRLEPILPQLISSFPDQIFSLDTSLSPVARWALEKGIHMINDISGFEMDPGLIDVVETFQVPYVLMHMQGNPQTMQSLASYDDVLQEVLDYFIHKLGALVSRDLTDIIIDPGFGFAKNADHNFELLQNLHIFRMLERPIMVGLSRKSTIQKTLNVGSEQALNGTTALHMVALQQGAQILRVHNVREAVECVQLFQELKKYDRSGWSV